MGEDGLELLDEAAWLDGLLALVPQPTWAERVSVGAAGIKVVLVEPACAGELVVEAWPDKIVVHRIGHDGSVVVRGVQEAPGSAHASLSKRRRTLRVPVISLDISRSTALASPGVLEKVPVGHLPPDIRESTCGATASAVQGAIDAIAGMNRRVEQVSNLFGRLQERAVKVICQDGHETTQAERLEGFESESGCDGDVVPCFSFEGVKIQEDESSAVYTGSIVWPAAAAMVRILLTQPVLPCALVAPFRVLELGAGSGLVGLVVAKRWPSASLLLTDREPALPFLAKNVAANFEEGIPDRVRMHALPWGPAGETQCAAFGTPDVVLAADTCYRRDLTRLFLWTLCCIGAPSNFVALALRPDSAEDFASACASHGVRIGRSWPVSSDDIRHLRLTSSRESAWELSVTDVIVYELLVPRPKPVSAGQEHHEGASESKTPR
eukprot:gnl/TRDRNA2_/TRDRNA2_61712_c0_seq2.p1 gnl/TRDRNA2_/TRDRNA2_61712_c0~~gnl/TRDRNA2_/TRDRNA2_61712_c0_seq2.p1  ORF type:complete len:438 (+),score=59.92 gnl/TRDRNA2_/TRDRNA2_61712_c0_seq2:21-1334(+)